MAGASDTHLMEQIRTKHVIIVVTNYQESVNVKVEEKETEWKILKKLLMARNYIIISFQYCLPVGQCKLKLL